MKKKWIAAAAACLLLSACGSTTTEAEQIVQGLSLENLPAPASVSHTDTHGGFHGDGETFAVLTFDETTAPQVETMLAEAGWSALPMEETLSIFAFGGERDGVDYSYNVLASHGVTPPENGRYYFLDRHSEASDAADLLERASINCTLALYDADTNTLYYCALDT